MQKSKPSVVVYDPDYGNPYGRELAVMLCDSYKVRYLGAQSTGWRPVGPHFLAGHKFSKDGHGSVAIYGAYAVALWQVLLRGLVGDVIVIVWCRTSFDRFLFALMSFWGLKVVYIVHNPQSRHREGLLRKCTESFLRRNSQIIIHSERLRALLQTSRLQNNAQVIPHTPFTAYCNEFKAEFNKDVPRVIFIGQLREDKSPGDMARFLQQYPRGRNVEFVFCGKGALTDSLRVASQGLHLIDRMDPVGVSDQVLCQELIAASVLVAPYRGVTQSGSIILALSFGIPVVAYRAGALPDIVDPKCLLPLGEISKMCDVVEMIISKQTSVVMPDIAAWRDQSILDWKSALEGL